MGEDDGVHVIAYITFYAVITLLSFVGCAMICCGSINMGKIYGVSLLLALVALSVMDFMTLSAINGDSSFDDGDQNEKEKNHHLMTQVFIWVAQVGILLNAAYDACDTSDQSERKMD